MPTKFNVNHSNVNHPFIQQPNARESAGARNILSHEDARTYIYIRTSAIFIHIGKLGYKKPIEIYALGTQTPGRQDHSRTNIAHQSEVLLQGQRPIQGSYPRLSSQEHFHTRVLTYFKWVFPRHFFEYKRSDSPSIIMHFEDNSL